MTAWNIKGPFMDWLNQHTNPKAPSTTPPPLPPSPISSDQPVTQHREVTEAELVAGQGAIRAVIDGSGYGAFVSNAQCRDLANRVLQAAHEVVMHSGQVLADQEKNPPKPIKKEPEQPLPELWDGKQDYQGDA